MSSFIIDRVGLIDNLLIWSGEYLDKRNIENIDEKLAGKIIDVIAEHEVYIRVEWDKSITADAQVDDKILELFKGTLLSADEEYQEYYVHVLDHLYLALESIVAKHIPRECWNLVFMKQVAGGIFVEFGEDYRIADWNRRMESGEWE